MFGNIVLWSWPLVAAILLNKKAVPTAIILTLIVGYLLLPEQITFDLPLLPALEKNTIPAISLFLLLLLGLGRDKTRVLPGWLPRGLVAKALLLMLIAGAFFTVITNPDPIIYGQLFLRGLRSYDAFSTILGYLMALLPFLLARKFLAYPEHNRTLITVFVFAGLFYSLLALYEVRMSPQLSNMVYGIFPHAWIQHVRGNGFRPIVFLQHGLWVSIFFTCTVLAAAGMARLAPKEQKVKYFAATGWLLFTLVLTKSLGALAIGLMLLPCVLFLGPRLQVTLCALFAAMVMTYPALRVSGFMPIEMLVGWAEGISTERAGSLQFRLSNEDQLLARAREKPIFGWAGWGRSSVFDQYGNETVTPDGYWVIVLGVGGWVRYIAEFGLLCAPMVIAALKWRKTPLGLEFSVLALMLTANLIDLIPNATVTPLTWMLAGVVWGRLELGQVKDLGPDAEPLAREAHAREPRYTRFARTGADGTRVDESPSGEIVERSRKKSYHRTSKTAPVS